jgi:hypothetical protein
VFVVGGRVIPGSLAKAARNKVAGIVHPERAGGGTWDAVGAIRDRLAFPPALGAFSREWWLANRSSAPRRLGGTPDAGRVCGVPSSGRHC